MADKELFNEIKMVVEVEMTFGMNDTKAWSTKEAQAWAESSEGIEDLTEQVDAVKMDLDCQISRAEAVKKAITAGRLKVIEVTTEKA